MSSVEQPMNVPDVVAVAEKKKRASRKMKPKVVKTDDVPMTDAAAEVAPKKKRASKKKAEAEAVPEDGEKAKKTRKRRAAGEKKNWPAKRAAIRKNMSVVAWRAAAKQCGFLLPGVNFCKIPRSGTPEHARIRARQQELVAEWKAIGEIPIEFLPIEVPELTPEEIAAGVVAPVPQKKKRTPKKPKIDSADVAVISMPAEIEVTA